MKIVPPFAFLALFPALAAAFPLAIENNTHTDIRNILVLPEKGKEPFFLRLDLAPGQKAEVENPDCAASLRIDAGIHFLKFENAPLESARILAISENPPLLELVGQNGGKTPVRGAVENILPQKGDRPVCELGDFRPRMSMSEVCGILPSRTPKDDNGAMLTGMGFAGLAWAARLAPETSPANPENPLLEHMELERPFSQTDIQRVISHLHNAGYAPWQAEFPHADLDFADMPDQKQEDRDNVLQNVLENYFRDGSKENAVIMFAPASSLNELANADNPEGDAQLFTLALRPEARKMTLDIAAYEAGTP